MIEYITASDEETIALGRKLAAEVLPPSGVVLLIGNLGAGKTTLAKGIAEGRAGVPREEVSSPTFSLIHEYGDPAAVYHADLYRLETAEEAGRLGLEDMIDSPALLLVEWGERFPDLWPGERTEILIDRIGGDQRRFRIRSANAS
jgi:tRNA threonylcarbamoyladenosine biosynthesis protein TsaE